MSTSDASRTTTDGLPPDPALAETDAPKPIDSATGQHGAYWILTADERAKGFVRPVRTAYRHVGAPGPQHALRDLLDDEQAKLAVFRYVKYETYPDEADRFVAGRYWTQSQLDKVGRGCGAVTTMGRDIAETYARQPAFYSRTFCIGCREHLPVGPQGEFVWDDAPGERVGA